MTTTSPCKLGPVQSPSSRWTMTTLDDAILISEGDPIIGPADWRRRMGRFLRTIPNAAVVGPKRISGGQIASMGEFVIDPRGFHSVGEGLPAFAHRFPLEVDAIARGSILVDRSWLVAAGGMQHEMDDLALLDLCLRIRQAGGRVFTIPDVTIESGSSASLRPSPECIRRFRRRWRFDYAAADLHKVEEMYRGQGLLWRPRLWGEAMPFDKYESRPAMHWESYKRVAEYHQRADLLAGLVCKATPEGLALDLGCGDGLFSHLVAQGGCEVLGVDTEALAVKQARDQVSGTSHSYPAGPPRFELVSGGALPLPDNSVRTVFMFDVIEHLTNPVATLREISRVLAPGGTLLITTPEAQFGRWSDPVYHVYEFQLHELVRLVNSSPKITVAETSRISGVYRDLVIAARKAA